MDRRNSRKKPRLKGYDYGQAGGYFVTFCTKNRKRILGEIPVGPDAPIGPLLQLSKIGELTEQAIQSAQTAYPHVQINYVIMPNHVHLAIVIQPEGGPMRASDPTVGMIVRSIKTLVTRQVGRGIWQEKFYDHVIRNEQDYLDILNYRENNPAKWAEDEYYHAQES